ncbi:MAG TPA: adenylate/guanylate cyclase domain-containing protein [Casimicrobiaceae bacterium]|nr:adenylate/guanylate cyclase domain-containing protein [Casimicrobiaceae bacterium]
MTPEDTADLADAGATAPASTPAPPPSAERAGLYVPRVLQQHLADDPAAQWWTAAGTAVFADVSGFTKLSESLARKGREGAEQITDAIGRVFETMLSVAYENGGSLLKFGGDALLLWFDGEGHAVRGCRAALLMREALRRVGTIELPDTTITLQVSQGVHSGQFHFFAVGASHREMLPVGPGWSRLASAEKAAGADEVLVTDETAAVLPADCLGDIKVPGALLRQEPPGFTEKIPFAARPALAHDTLARCLSLSIREHVIAGGGTSEHRPVTIAFIHFEGTDALIEQQGPAAAADALHRIMAAVEAAAEEQDVAFLASDVDADGGKLILTAGAPKVSGNDEERMLLALRKIVASDLPLPIRVGVNRGAVFAGDIGPAYRRTYTVMGDAVNLTARLMAKAERGAIYATGEVLDRSSTLFEATQLEPFAVKGKAEPVRAWSVGRALGSKARQSSEPRLPLTGRNAELGVIRKAYTSARSGAGRLIDVVGEAGMGKTRLLEALRDAAAGFRKLHATCEAYTASVPYALWRELLREVMEFGRDTSDAVIVERLRQELAARAPDLAPWLPLIAIAFGIEVEETPEIELLAEQNRRVRLHESVAAFLEVVLPASAMIEIENAHQMDEASAELLGYLVAEKIGLRPWLLAVARRRVAAGFAPPESDTVVRVELKPLAAQDALRMAQLATQQNPLPAHVLEVVATRSGGNPQFLRDLLRTAIQSGGVDDLPDSAEAAAIAQIDDLAPEDRALVRRAAVFGLTFHPRMLAWLTEEGEEAVSMPTGWERLRDLFEEEPDGYLRFRRSLLRDAAYEGLPYRSRRRLHAQVAAHLEAESDSPDEAAGILSLHYFSADEYQPAWRYACIAAERAEAAYAHVEAAGLYSRALDAGRKLPELDAHDLASVHRALGDVWYRASEYRKAAECYAAAQALVADDRIEQAGLMLKLSYVEEKLGKFAEALRYTERTRELLHGVQGPEAARLLAESSSWCAQLYHFEGRNTEAIEWAERGVAESEAADDKNSLGQAYYVVAMAYAQLGKEGAQPLMGRSLEAYQESGNLERQATVVLNLGAVCHWEGRWDEALGFYERGREANLKVGNRIAAAIARLNMAEILTDRGEWAEAEALLLETLPLWKASQYRFFLAACLFVLGRVSLRLGRLDEALARFEESKASFLHVGANEEVPAVDARIVECWVEMGRLDEALAMIGELLARTEDSEAVVRLMPLVQRMQGHALIKQGDLWGARDALEASLAAAKEKHNLFETMLTMLSLIELDRLEGVEPPIEMQDESRSLLARLKVRAAPPVPTPIQ